MKTKLKTKELVDPIESKKYKKKKFDNKHDPLRKNKKYYIQKSNW